MNSSSKIISKKQITRRNYITDTLKLKPTADAPIVKVKKIKSFLDLEGTIKSKFKYSDKLATKKIKEYIHSLNT